VAKPADMKVLTWLAEDPRFAIPITPIENIIAAPSETLIRVAGIVHSVDQGSSVTIRDETGQARLFSDQIHGAKIGDEIEAIGYGATENLRFLLQQSLIRIKAGGPGSAGGVTRPLARLRAIEQVGELSPEEARKGYPVAVLGVVTWADPTANLFFLQDGSGAVKVVTPSDGSVAIPKWGSLASVTGVTEAGDFAPIVRSAAVQDRGQTPLPRPEAINYEQARAGVAHAQWIQIRGYVAAVASEGDRKRIELTTSKGKFHAHSAERGACGTGGRCRAPHRGV
jgi:hypothetical protein